MCMWFGYITLIIFFSLFLLCEMLSKCMGTLWGQLLLQFSTDCFETLQMLSAWNEDEHAILV